MLASAQKLHGILNSAPAKLLAFTEAQASERPAPGKWSKKEIIGHLIDSASNNHQRFVRLQLGNNIALPNYKQDDWVSQQDYNAINWIDLVKFWLIYNKHLLHVLNHVDQSKLGNTATIEGKTITLQFFIDDYVAHMEHHLKAVFIP